MEKPINKITQYFPAQLGKQTITLTDNKLVIDWQTFFSSYQTTVELKDINPNYDLARSAFDGWNSFSWFFFFVAIVMCWIPPLKGYILIPLTAIIIFFLLRFKKYDWACFKDLQRGNVFLVRYSGSPQEKTHKKAFVENLVNQIKK